MLVTLSLAAACTFGSAGGGDGASGEASGDDDGPAQTSATSTLTSDGGPVVTGGAESDGPGTTTANPGPGPTTSTSSAATTSGTDSGGSTTAAGEETCNGIDDDNDGAVDEFSPANESCGPCRYEVGPHTTFVYSFCSEAVDQPTARTRCQDLGADLASIHEKATNDFIFGEIEDRSFIGFNDVVSEGDFEWTDTTPVDFVVWDGGEPNDAGSGQDCVVMRDAEPNWDDVTCGVGHFYVCRAPL